jgi:5-methylcytosine-specific restriction endonuclease McrA
MVDPRHVGNPRQCTADHLIAIADGGQLTAENNIVAACHACNNARSKRKTR